MAACDRGSLVGPGERAASPPCTCRTTTPRFRHVVWFRDYAAYCGLTASGKQLYAVVAQIAARKPVMAKKLSPWSPGENQPPACAAASVWQREPLQVTFQPSGAAAVSYDLVGLSAVLVEDGDGNEEPATASNTH